MVEFQSIESAPRNGSIIVALENTATKYGLCLVSWKDGEWREVTCKTVQHPTHWKQQVMWRK